MMRRVWRLAAPVAIGIAAGFTPTPAGAGDVLKIGAPLAATGAEAREGALAKQGYDLWAETVNARGGLKVGAKSYRVEIIYYDDQSKPQISAELTDRLISQDHVSFLLGPYGSPATFADAAVAEKYRVPMVEANGAARKIFAQGYRYVFGVLSPADEYGVSMLRAAATLTLRLHDEIADMRGDETLGEGAGGLDDIADDRKMLP